MPGVVAVLTGQDLTDVWVLPPRLPVANKAMVRPMMAQGVVRFVGEPVAVVLAESRAEAVDAAEAVVVDTESLPAVIDLDDALRGDIVLHEGSGSNVSFEWSMPPFETDPFAVCDVVDEFTIRHPRLHAGPLEPRAGAAVWGADGRCTSWVCSQRPAGAKYVIECALGLEPGTVRAIAPDVGGGFGAKGGYGCQPEDVVIAWAARRLGRPVRWVETRSESMLAMGHGRASTHRVRIGGTIDGQVLAYEVAAVQDSGAYPAMGTFITTNLRNSGTGVYEIPTARVSGRSVVTNTSSTMALRGAGRPEASCDIERAIDRYAILIGCDPVEVRRRNLVPSDAFPYKTAVGSTYDSGRYAEALDRCVEAAGYDALRAEQAELRGRGGATRHWDRGELHGGDHRWRRGGAGVGEHRGRRFRHSGGRHLAARTGTRNHVRGHCGQRVGYRCRAGAAFFMVTPTFRHSAVAPSGRVRRSSAARPPTVPPAR